MASTEGIMRFLRHPKSVHDYGEWKAKVVAAEQVLKDASGAVSADGRRICARWILDLLSALLEPAALKSSEGKGILRMAELWWCLQRGFDAFPELFAQDAHAKTVLRGALEALRARCAAASLAEGLFAKVCRRIEAPEGKGRGRTLGPEELLGLLALPIADAPLAALARAVSAQLADAPPSRKLFEACCRLLVPVLPRVHGASEGLCRGLLDRAFFVEDHLEGFDSALLLEEQPTKKRKRPPYQSNFWKGLWEAAEAEAGRGFEPLTSLLPTVLAAYATASAARRDQAMADAEAHVSLKRHRLRQRATRLYREAVLRFAAALASGIARSRGGFRTPSGVGCVTALAARVLADGVYAPSEDLNGVQEETLQRGFGLAMGLAADNALGGGGCGAEQLSAATALFKVVIDLQHRLLDQGGGWYKALRLDAASGCGAAGGEGSLMQVLCDTFLKLRQVDVLIGHVFDMCRKDEASAQRFLGAYGALLLSSAIAKTPPAQAKMLMDAVERARPGAAGWNAACDACLAAVAAAVPVTVDSAETVARACVQLISGDGRDDRAAGRTLCALLELHARACFFRECVPRDLRVSQREVALRRTLLGLARRGGEGLDPDTAQLALRVVQRMHDRMTALNFATADAGAGGATGSNEEGHAPEDLRAIMAMVIPAAEGSDALMERLYAGVDDWIAYAPAAAVDALARWIVDKVVPGERPSYLDDAQLYEVPGMADALLKGLWARALPAAMAAALEGALADGDYEAAAAACLRRRRKKGRDAGERGAGGAALRVAFEIAQMTGRDRHLRHHLVVCAVLLRTQGADADSCCPALAAYPLQELPRALFDLALEALHGVADATEELLRSPEGDAAWSVVEAMANAAQAALCRRDGGDGEAVERLFARIAGALGAEQQARVLLAVSGPLAEDGSTAGRFGGALDALLGKAKERADGSGCGSGHALVFGGVLALHACCSGGGGAADAVRSWFDGLAATVRRARQEGGEGRPARQGTSPEDYTLWLLATQWPAMRRLLGVDDADASGVPTAEGEGEDPSTAPASKPSGAENDGHGIESESDSGSDSDSDGNDNSDSESESDIDGDGDGESESESDSGSDSDSDSDEEAADDGRSAGIDPSAPVLELTDALADVLVELFRDASARAEELLGALVVNLGDAEYVALARSVLRSSTGAGARSTAARRVLAVLVVSAAGERRVRICRAARGAVANAFGAALAGADAACHMEGWRCFRYVLPRKDRFAISIGQLHVFLGDSSAAIDASVAAVPAAGGARAARVAAALAAAESCAKTFGTLLNAQPRLATMSAPLVLRLARTLLRAVAAPPPTMRCAAGDDGVDAAGARRLHQAHVAACRSVARCLESLGGRALGNLRRHLVALLADYAAFLAAPLPKKAMREEEQSVVGVHFHGARALRVRAEVEAGMHALLSAMSKHEHVHLMSALDATQGAIMKTLLKSYERHGQGHGHGRARAR